MTKTIATRRLKSAAEEEEKKVQVESPETAEVKPAPKVKRMEEPAPAKAAPAPTVRAAAVVELVEGNTYEIHGMRFISRRPVVVTDQRILSAVSVNSRFKVTGVEGGEK